jgi:hypothetical protein
MRQPSWYLLLWAAFVASIVASSLGFAARRHLRERAPGRAILLGILLGTLLWGPIYGIAFELLGAANVLAGAVLGSLHGATTVGLAVLRRRDQAPADDHAAGHGRRIITRAVYGAILGFLYVVPGA